MSDLQLIPWKKERDSKYVNSVPKGTLVFIYGKALGSEKHKDTDAANEFFIKRQLGLDEEEEIYENTQGYLKGIGKNDVDSLTNKKIESVIKINEKIVQFILTNLHELYWRDFSKGIISTMNLNRAVDLIVTPANLFRKALLAGVDKKYDSGLVNAQVKNNVELHKVEINQAMGKNVPNIKKSSKKK